MISDRHERGLMEVRCRLTQGTLDDVFVSHLFAQTCCNKVLNENGGFLDHQSVL